MQLGRFDETRVKGLVRRDAVLTFEELFAGLCKSQEVLYIFVVASPNSLALNETLGHQSLNILLHQPLVRAISERHQVLIPNDAKAADVVHGSNFVAADGINLPADAQ